MNITEQKREETREAFFNAIISKNTFKVGDLLKVKEEMRFDEVRKYFSISRKVVREQFIGGSGRENESSWQHVYFDIDGKERGFYCEAFELVKE